MRRGGPGVGGGDTVDGTKNFQPTGDSHIVVEFHVVCTPGEETADTSILYVNAVQNGFALKKSDTSASVGLSVLGSLSLASMSTEPDAKCCNRRKTSSACSS